MCTAIWSSPSVSEFWREKIDRGGNGWSLSSYTYGYTLAVIVIILTCHLLNSRLLFASSFLSVFGFRERSAAHPHAESNDHPDVSPSAPSDVRITTVISDLDLKNLIDDLNKKFQANEKWEDVINRRTDRLSYCGNPLRTQAGDASPGDFPLNVTTSGNQVNVSTGVDDATVANAIYTDGQLAVYQVDKVLQPLSIFAAPAPAIAPAPATLKSKRKSPAGLSPSSGSDDSPADNSGVERIAMHGTMVLVFGVSLFTLL